MKKLVTILVAVAAMVAISVPALAVEPSSYTFDMGARMLTDIGWQSKSEELTKNQSSEVGSWFVNVPAHSYLRARFYSVDKNVGGRIELGLKSVQPDATVSLRYAYGYWRVGNCRILAGQTDNWFGSTAFAPKQFVGNSISNGYTTNHLMFMGWGFVWPHRVPQVQFTYETDQWGIQFALEEPRNKSTLDDASDVDNVFIMPRMTLTAMVRYGAFMFQPGVMYVKHGYEAGDTGSSDEEWDTMIFLLPIKFAAGPFTLKFQGHYGKNFATEIPFYETKWTKPVLNGSEVEDTIIWGGSLAGEYKIGKLMLTGGVGYENWSNDTWTNDDEITRWAAFVAVPYQFTTNFGIHPEFAYYKYGDNPNTGEDMGNEWVLGVQFRFIF
ncbi:MAG: hypothetical protein KKC30_00480 [Proteobacteria bacterium]|nr:hypothetical protein [Pseudomonadota bacterium]MBU4383045.1 hypothetical protein [Pseudomonadota bacterium]MCG2762851.1 hypothetical protein [Desulfarculaceae bacterium]